MKRIMIAGYGEIGKAISKLYKKNYKAGYTDIIYGKNIYMTNVDVLHICIPFNRKFIEETKRYIMFYNPKLTIIHSTVPVLTTSVIETDLDNLIVHSPCMGHHPNLAKGIKTFTKIVAGYNKKAVRKACKHFKKLGVKTIVYNSPEESELAKLLDTTYYATAIYYMQKVHDLCKEWSLDFNNVYTNTNKIYNEGYTKLGDTQFIRPVLQYMGKGIGGHCLYENAKILNRERMLKKLTRLILSLGKSK